MIRVTERSQRTCNLKYDEYKQNSWRINKNSKVENYQAGKEFYIEGKKRCAPDGESPSGASVKT
ncbi:hypothetical protein Pcaca04_33050 [Pectobacterium carotovorum subsp. carotovorum]|nr:hypothetical protein Pcaca04_33050 [Pectobacterium carotovorum subsp. carotovorum]